MASELEKALEQARKDAEKARKDAASDTKGGGKSKLSKELEKARADAAKAAGDAKKGGGLFDTAKNVAGGALTKVVDALGAPQQAVFRTGSAVAEAARGDFGNAITELGRAGKELATVGQGQENISAAQAMTPVEAREAGYQTKLPKYFAGSVDVFGDPTLVGIGSKAKLAKEAIETATRQGGKELGEKAAKGTLSAAERQAIESTTRAGALEAGATGGKRSLGEMARGVAKPASLSADEGAERVVSRVTRGLDTAAKRQAVTPAGRALPALKNALKTGDDATNSVARALTSVKESDFSHWIEDALKPRAAIARDFGQKVADSVRSMGGERLANVSRVVADTMAEVQSEISVLGRTITKEEQALLGQALRGGTPNVTEELLPLFRRLQALETKSREVLEQGGKAPGQSAPDTNFARQWLLENKGIKLPPKGTTKAAPTAPGKPAKVSQSKLDKLPITDESAIKDVLNRYFKAVHAQETTRYMSDLATITDEAGTPLAQIMKSADDIPEGWQRLQAKAFGGQVAVPSSIAKEVDRIGAIIGDDSAIKGFEKFVDKFDRFWKGSATSLPVGVAFTARNARSNLFLNWLDGLHSVAPYAEAAKLQKAAGTILKGDKYAEEIRTLGADAVLKRHLTARQYNIYRQAQANQVIGANYFDIDLAFSGTAHTSKVRGVESGATGVERAKQAVGTDGAAFQAGRRMNSAVEDNARLANFIHNLDRFGDVKRAAEHTKKFLFDYTDLTAFEQRKLRQWIPFYTFMRKNVPLQVEQAMMQPGKISLRAQAGQALSEDLPEGAPSYMERTGARGLSGVASGVLGAGAKAVFTPDTPLSAAASVVDPFAKLVSSLPAIARGDAPDSLKAEAWSPVFSMLGGTRGSLVKLFAGEAAGVNTFSGAELNPADTRDRLIKAMLPFVARAQALRLATDEDPTGLETLIKQEKQADESIQQFILRQAGIRTQKIK